MSPAPESTVQKDKEIATKSQKSKQATSNISYASGLKVDKVLDMVKKSAYGETTWGLYSKIYCNMNAFFSFDLFVVYIPECKQQLRTME